MTNEPKNEAIFDALLGAVWPTMQEHGLDSCITGSRVAFDVCKEHDIAVRVVKTQVRVYNPPMVERINAGQRPKDAAEVEQWHHEDGSWNVGIGGFGYDHPGRFDGHLVVLADSRVLLDPTIPQANRPDKGILLHPLACRVENWPQSGDTVGGVIRGSLVVYGPEPDDRRWVATESWSALELRAPVLDAAREAVDSALSSL